MQLYPLSLTILVLIWLRTAGDSLNLVTLNHVFLPDGGLSAPQRRSARLARDSRESFSGCWKRVDCGFGSKGSGKKCRREPQMEWASWARVAFIGAKCFIEKNARSARKAERKEKERKEEEKKEKEEKRKIRKDERREDLLLLLCARKTTGPEKEKVSHI